MVWFSYFTETAVYWCYLVTASDICHTSVKSVFSKQMHINLKILRFNIQQMYALPTLNICVLYLTKDKHRLVPITT